MSPPHRVGILTFHRCINYGSYWQARCLAEGLRALGHDAVIMDHHAPAITRAEWRCALHPVPGASPADRAAYQDKARRFLAAFDQLPCTPAFSLHRPRDAGPFDRVLVGSDEVWNLRHPWYGGQPLFYGEGLESEIVSYAASFGNQDARHTLPAEWSARLKSFSAIAVRDQNSRSIVSDAIDADPQIVLDPCLQFPDAIEPGESPIFEPYAVIYGHSFPDWFARLVRAWADDRDLTLVSIGYRNGWADRQWIEAGPDDFASLMANATAVATNFFHGCVFSLVNGKPFVCAPSDYRNNKVRDLLGLLGPTQRLLTEGTTPEDAGDLLGVPAGAHTDALIRELRQTSHQYLARALN